MTSPIGLCLILLTYKGKVLLLQQEDVLNAENNDHWHFITKVKRKNEQPEKAIIQEVYRETQILLPKVSLLSSNANGNTVEYLYHARLTDADVNMLNRASGRLLNFFSLKELPGLRIHPLTKSFFQSNGNLSESLSVSL